MFQGCISAIVTPFQSEPNGFPEIDWKSLDNLVEWQIASGIDGIVACGSTGEAATLSDSEKYSVIKRVCEVVRGRVPVIAGTGTNSTKSSLEMTQGVKALKVDGALIVAPYYNKPTQEGLFQHFATLAQSGGLPVVVYNIPGRSVVEIAPSTFRRLVDIPGIVALKHAVDSITRLVEVSDSLQGKVSLLAGDDPMVHAIYSVGGKGVISACASVFPKMMKSITEAGQRGDLADCLKHQIRALPYIQGCFLETNPVPAKTVLKMQGIIASDAVRLPLVSVSEDTRKRLTNLFAGFSDE